LSSLICPNLAPISKLILTGVAIAAGEVAAEDHGPKGKLYQVFFWQKKVPLVRMALVAC